MHAKGHCYSLLHRILGHRRLTPNRISPVPIFTPGWRETKWNEVPWLKNQRRATLEHQTSSSVVRGVNRSATNSASFDFLLLFINLSSFNIFIFNIFLSPLVTKSSPTLCYLCQVIPNYLKISPSFFVLEKVGICVWGSPFEFTVSNYRSVPSIVVKR